MKRKSFILCLISLCLILSVEVFAQSKIEGVIMDAASSEPLPGVIVQAKNGEGRMLVYRLSDKDGRFSFDMPEGVVRIQVALMGYRTVILDPPFDGVLTVRMEVSKEQLKASVVKSSIVEEKGDTIVHSAAAYRSREDVSLGDILKKIPGIAVTEKGFVEFNGKAINTLYIDGRNLLDKDYNFATRNLRSSDIKTVEVYRNHQPIKALQELIDSESAALNIVLTDEARGRWTLTASAAGGVAADDPVSAAYDSYANAIRTTAGNATFNRVALNNAGTVSDLARSLPENVIVVGEDRHNRYKVNDYVITEDFSAPVEQRYADFNTSVSAQSLNYLAIGQDASLKAAFKYAYDALASEMTSDLLYLSASSEDDAHMGDFSSALSRQHIGTGSLSYVNNNRKFYIKNMLYCDFSRRESLLEAETFSGSTPGSGVSQDVLLSRLNINNTLSAIIRTSGGGAYQVSWYSQESFHDSSMDIPARGIRQNVDNDIAYGIVRVGGISRSVRGWNFALKPNFEYTLRRIATEDANLEQCLLVPGADLEITKRIGRTKVSLGGNGNWHNYISGTPDGNASLFIYGYRLQVEQRWSRLQASLALGRSADTGSIQEMGDMVIRQNHRMLWTGRNSYLSVPSESVSLSAKYAFPTAGLYLNGYASISRKASFTYSRTVYEDEVLTIASDDVRNSTSYDAELSVSKSLPALKGKFDIGIGTGHARSSLVQNGTLVEYESRRLSPDMTLTINPVRFFSLKYDGRFSLTRFGYGAVSPDGIQRSLEQNLTLSLMPDNLPIVESRLYHYLTTFGGSDQGTFLLDLGLRHRLTRTLELSLSATNLFNSRYLIYRSTGPLLESEYRYRLRPCTVLLGLKIDL